MYLKHCELHYGADNLLPDMSVHHCVALAEPITVIECSTTYSHSSRFRYRGESRGLEPMYEWTWKML